MMHFHFLIWGKREEADESARGGQMETKPITHWVPDRTEALSRGANGLLD